MSSKLKYISKNKLLRQSIKSDGVCQISRCFLPVCKQSKIYCSYHNKKFKLHEKELIQCRNEILELFNGENNQTKTCVIPGCNKLAYHNNICKKHIKYLVHFAKCKIPDMKKIQLTKYAHLVKFLFYISKLESCINEFYFYFKELRKFSVRTGLKTLPDEILDMVIFSRDKKIINSILNVVGERGKYVKNFKITQEILKLDEINFENTYKLILKNIWDKIFK